MKHIVFTCLAILLLTSCGVTKRRYLSGFSIDWTHKKPPSHLQKPQQISGNTAISPTLRVMPSQSYSTQDTISLYKSQSPFLASKITPENKPIAMGQKLTYSKVLMEFPKDSANNITKPGKEVCPEAKRSLTDGILSIALPAGIILLAILLGTASDAGSGGFVLLGFLFLGALLSGLLYLIFGILAVINGVNALDKIKMNPEKYSGKAKATIGIILGLWLLIALVLSTPFW